MCGKRLHIIKFYFLEINKYRMIDKQHSSRPIDVVVALQLTITPEVIYAALSESVGISISEAHSSVSRLKLAALLRPEKRAVATSSLIDFLKYGLRHVFPPQFGPQAVGVPTAHSAPSLSRRLASTEPIVWPHAEGTLVGMSLIPLCSSAPEFVASNPPLYELLTLVDSLRIGQSLERGLAEQGLREKFEATGGKLR